MGASGTRGGRSRALLSHPRVWRKFQSPPFLCFSFRTILTVVLPAPFGWKWRGMKSRGELSPVGAGVLSPLFLPPSPEHGSWECLCKWQEGGRSLMGHCQWRSDKTGCSEQPEGRYQHDFPMRKSRLGTEKSSGWGLRHSQTGVFENSQKIVVWRSSSSQACQSQGLAVG